MEFIWAPSSHLEPSNALVWENLDTTLRIPWLLSRSQAGAAGEATIPTAYAYNIGEAKPKSNATDPERPTS